MAEDYSKELFKKLGLYHWSPNTKMILTLFMIIGPLCFIVVGSSAVGIIKVYNKASKYFFKKKVNGLMKKEEELILELEKLTGRTVKRINKPKTD